MKERLYNLVVINEKTGMRVQLNSTPLTHEQGCIMKSKQTYYSWRRIVLEEIINNESTIIFEGMEFMWKQYKHPTDKTQVEYRTHVITPAFTPAILKIWYTNNQWYAAISSNSDSKNHFIDIASAKNVIDAQTKATAAAMRLGCSVDKRRNKL